MPRRCDRPGCSEPAAVAYGFDADRLLVWLDRLVDDDRARAGALCLRHGSRLTVPRGWWLDDRRVDAPELFRGADAAGANETPARKSGAKAKPGAPRRRSRKPAAAEVALVDGSETVRPTPGDPTLDEALAAEHRTGRGARGGRTRAPASTPVEAPPAVPPADVLPVDPPSVGRPSVDVPDEAAVRRHPAATEPEPSHAAPATEPEPAVLPNDPAFAAMLEPSSPLLARAFTGVARPDRPARGRRNGTAAVEHPAAEDVPPAGPGPAAPDS